MFPSTNTLDFMNERNRLFPKTENDLPNIYNANLSPYNQSMVNRSSSSADSMSPESYMDATFSPEVYDRRLTLPDPGMYGETPFPTKRERPIVGRRLLSNQGDLFGEPSKLNKMEFETNIWQPDMQRTPPNTNIGLENQNYIQNNFYELFPSENKGYEFKSPVKPTRSGIVRHVSPNISTNLPNMSPNVSPNVPNVSPNRPHMSYTPRFSPPSPKQANFPNPPFRPTFAPRFVPNSPRLQLDAKQQGLCTFCRKNGETPMVYMTHNVKEKVGNKYVVTCPILRSHVCSTCGASGDNAHTITYCPVLRSGNNGHPLPSTTITLKNTRIKSNGRRRF